MVMSSRVVFDILLWLTAVAFGLLLGMAITPTTDPLEQGYKAYEQQKQFEKGRQEACPRSQEKSRLPNYWGNHHYAYFKAE